MAQPLLLNLLGTIGCIILLFFGLRLSKHKRKRIMIIGYLFILTGLLALFFNLYIIMEGI
jgi:hypothetical protein